MSKGIELTQSQIKAYESGATMFLFPIEISNFCKDMGNTLDDIEKVIINDNGNTYSIYFKGDDRQVSEMPIKKSDKGILVKYNLKHTCDNFNMAEEDNCKACKVYSFSECIDIKIIRPKEIACKEYFNKEELREISLMWVGNFNQEAYKQIGCQLFIDMYNQQMKEQNINRTYNDNDYMFLVQFKR